MTRLTLAFVGKHLPGARFVIANRAGAGGQVGFEASFNAAPNGYTLGPVAVPTLDPFPVERQVCDRPLDVTFLPTVVYDPDATFVGRGSPSRSLKDLVDAARAKPGELPCGNHRDRLGRSHPHALARGSRARPADGDVLFAGFAPMLSDVLGGHIQVAVGTVLETLAAMRDGGVHSLGQAAGERWSEAAGEPTIRERGFDITGGSSRGIVGPPGIAEGIVRRLEERFRAAFADAGFLRDAARRRCRSGCWSAPSAARSLPRRTGPGRDRSASVPGDAEVRRPGDARSPGRPRQRFTPQGSGYQPNPSPSAAT